MVSKDVQDILQLIGKLIRAKRRSRYITMKRLSDDARISRVTLTEMEKGSPNVSIGLYFEVLCLLGVKRYLWDLANQWAPEKCEEEKGRKKVGRLFS